jgi:hypothetical protein
MLPRVLPIDQRIDLAERRCPIRNRSRAQRPATLLCFSSWFRQSPIPIRFRTFTGIYAGDAPVHVPYEGVKGVTITMNYPSISAAEPVFKALSEGGNVMMPFQPTFWAKSAGTLTDKFGTAWNINGAVII